MVETKTLSVDKHQVSVATSQSLHGYKLYSILYRQWRRVATWLFTFEYNSILSRTSVVPAYNVHPNGVPVCGSVSQSNSVVSSNSVTLSNQLSHKILKIF